MIRLVRVFLGVGFAGVAVALSTRQGLLLVVALGMWAAALMALLWHRWALAGIRVATRFDPERVFPGESARLTIAVENRSLLPVPWLMIQIRMPQQLRPLKGTVRVEPSQRALLLEQHFTLAHRQRVTRRIDVTGVSRGAHRLGEVLLFSSDPLHLGDVTGQVSTGGELLVYPRTVPIRDAALTSLRPFGVQEVRGRLFSDPEKVVGVRPYRPEDPPRQIHWKATARQPEEIMVKETDPSVQPALLLLVDPVEYRQGQEFLAESTVDLAAEAAASLARWAFERRWSLGLGVRGLTAGSGRQVRVPMGRQRDQLRRVLTALAAMVPAGFFIDRGRWLAAETRRIGHGTRVVLVVGRADRAAGGWMTGLERRGFPAQILTVSADGSEAGVRATPWARLAGLGDAGDGEPGGPAPGTVRDAWARS